MSDVIVCNDLTKKYKEKTALDNFSTVIGENKIIGLVGRNGAGKTTFLKTCAGYLLPTSGSIKILGQEPFDNLDVLTNLVFIDEEVQFQESVRLKDLLKLGGIYYRNWDSTFAWKLLKYFGLNEKLKYKKLSRGMKTQFNVIMGLACRAPVTLMDEPTLGLDAAVRKEFYNILMKDYLEHPRTFIISSHLMNEIENLLDEMILIHGGKLVFHKSMEELLRYALTLQGKSDVLEAFAKKKQVLYSELFGNSLMVGIKNDMSNEDYQYLTKNNIDIGKARVEDVYIWMTRDNERGGFDAFKG